MLVGRSGLPDRAEWDGLPGRATTRKVAAVRAMERLGATVHVAAADVADPTAHGRRSSLAWPAASSRRSAG